MRTGSIIDILLGTTSPCMIYLSEGSDPSAADHRDPNEELESTSVPLHIFLRFSSYLVFTSYRYHLLDYRFFHPGFQIHSTMVSLKAVQGSNAGLRALPNITALFVGGTSGIGQSTLRQLAQGTEKPTAYIVGRNESKTRPFLAELRQLNPEGQFNFVEADVSLIRNVDATCDQILRREKHLNFLFMTPGGISLGGRKGK